jgi:hypothetical protein
MSVNLCDKYRPRTFEAVCGQDKCVKALLRLRDKGGLAGRAYWISGPGSGIGKSTIANIIATDVAERDFITRMDAGDLGVPELREIEEESRYYGWGEKGGRAYIIEEAHGLKAGIVRRLKTTLEPVRPHVAWIFTTTQVGEELLFEGTEEASPLMDRCVKVKLTNQGLAKAGGTYVKAIAEREGLDGQDVAAYERLFKDNKNSFRAVLERVQGGAMRE